MLSLATWGEFCADINTYSQISSLITPNNAAVRKDRARKMGIRSSHASVLQKLSSASIVPFYSRGSSYYDTSNLPVGCMPEGGLVPPERLERKLAQVSNMLAVAMPVVDFMLRSPQFPRIRIVEFCAGSGFVGLPIAWNVLTRGASKPFEIILLDWKGPSLDIARKRIAQTGLSAVVRVVEMDQAYFDEDFDLGVSLHACGGASDVHLKKCLDCGAAFVACPCCLGKVLHHRQTPLSARFQEALDGVSSEPFSFVVRAGDFGHGSEVQVKGGHKEEAERRLAKSMVEEDRRLWMEEGGYRASLRRMRPSSASAKHDMILGTPKVGAFAAFSWDADGHEEEEEEEDE